LKQQLTTLFYTSLHVIHRLIRSWRISANGTYP